MVTIPYLQHPDDFDSDCTEADVPRLYRFTGAGAGVTEALSSGKPLPAQMASALEEICGQGIRRQAMILADAEQQFVQPGIDRAAAELMRRYNTGGGALVYNTYQAYLKATPRVLGAHLRQARRDGFALGVKLVRGSSSIPIKYGQLLGMADEVSCTLLQLKAGGAGPEAYKCLSWGSLDDCLSYLIRRAVEDRDAVSRTVTEYQALKREIWRRLRATVGLS